MSRNFRRKSPETPVQKKSRRTSRATDNSSDDDYDGVDLIPDSEEDEPDVEGVEEQAIIESEEDEDDDTPRPIRSHEEFFGAWGGFDNGSFDGTMDETFFDEHMARMHAPEQDVEEIHRNSSISSSSVPADTPRRVHFDVSDSDDLDTDEEDPFFPDIFLDQNSLDPKFRRIIENDNDEEPPLSDEEFWGSVGNNAGNAEQEQNDDDASDSGSFTDSSGYETDEGETTEEDIPVVARFVPAKSVLKPISDEADDAEEITVNRRAPVRHSGPRLGSFFHDKRKSFAVMDSNGKKMVMFRAKLTRRYSFNGIDSHQKLNTIPENDNELLMDMQMSPMISNSGNLMLSAMYTPLDTFAGQAVGPPEAFLPFTSISADGIITQDSASSFDEDDIDDEELWKLEDFLNFGGETSGSENGDDDQDPSPSSDTAEQSSTPARPATATSDDVHPLLNHFGSNDVVGAFRRNQNRHQLLTRNALSQEALQFSGPYGQGTLRGIKGGRLAAANTPITPMRKRKNIQPIGSSPGSPLANISAVNGKRKFDGDHFGHKRSRSNV